MSVPVSRPLPQAASAGLAGRALATALIAFAALAAGVGGGFLAANRSATSGAAGAGDEDGWYTCGMHPDVIQKGPGDCPICQMKLTPLKKDDGGGEETRKGPGERKVLYWRAPMDPSYVRDKPGKSPMGMDLVPVFADAGESAGSQTIRIDPVTVQNMGVRTQAVRRGPLAKTIRTVGRVDYDEQRVTFVDTKFNGWIETLYVNETGQEVKKGQRLFDVYSPELYAAQEEYLAAVRSAPLFERSTIESARENARRLVEAAATKLRYMDVSEEQIEDIKRTGQAKKTLAVHSPANGIVTEKMALEGMYVKPGMRLYTIADLSRVWVLVDVYEYQLPWVRVGQSAEMTLSYLPGRREPFKGKAVYIYPYLDARTRVIKVRLEFPNDGLELKPGMFASVTLRANLHRDALLVPREAYIDSGTRKVAFVTRGEGKFDPRDIETGVEAEDGMVEVVRGLEEGDVVVTSGQFLLDSESKLKEAVAKMMELQRAKEAGAKEPASKHEHGEPGGATATAAAGIPAGAKYACPMDTHPGEADPENQGAYFSEKEGKCPLCGMTLAPLDDLEWAKALKAAEGAGVAYSCPEHPAVVGGEAAPCPKCERKLEPFKAMYTCAKTEHAGEIATEAGSCRICGEDLVVFRGVWLSEAMAGANVPKDKAPADAARLRCPVHPLVHANTEARCTICARALEPRATAQDPETALTPTAGLYTCGMHPDVVQKGPGGCPVCGMKLTPLTEEDQARVVPADAAFVCPMESCWHFSSKEGECPVCGMFLKPLDEVAWAKEAKARAAQAATSATGPTHVCPMHPEVQAPGHGTCPICGMQLVTQEAVRKPEAPPERVAVQMDFLIEHYLELGKRLAADRTDGVALHALGAAAAAEELSRAAELLDASRASAVTEAATAARAAALQLRGESLDGDRVAFGALSEAVRVLVDHARPDRERWPALHVLRCPVSKGSWLQRQEEVRNPFYGFKNLKCGEIVDTLR